MLYRLLKILLNLNLIKSKIIFLIDLVKIKLSEELAGKVYDYIEKLKEDDENILSGDTEGKITW